MRKLTLMCVFVLFLTACAKTNAQEIPQKEKEVVIVDTTKKETQTLGDATIKKETVVPTEVKEQEEKPTVEQPKKEEVKQKEENKKTQPVQPQPDKKEVKVEQKPIVKPEVPKSLPKTPVASAKPKPTPAPEKPQPVERKRLGSLGNSGLEFKTYDEARNHGEKILDSIGSKTWEDLNNKMGFKIAGWSGWTVDYSDGSQTWTIHWKP